MQLSNNFNPKQSMMEKNFSTQQDRHNKLKIQRSQSATGTTQNKGGIQKIAATLSLQAWLDVHCTLAAHLSQARRPKIDSSDSVRTIKWQTSSEHHRKVSARKQQKRTTGGHGSDPLMRFYHARGQTGALVTTELKGSTRGEAEGGSGATGGRNGPTGTLSLGTWSRTSTSSRSFSTCSTGYPAASNVHNALPCPFHDQPNLKPRSPFKKKNRW